jgi:hypothetical protein
MPAPSDSVKDIEQLEADLCEAAGSPFQPNNPFLMGTFPPWIEEGNTSRVSRSARVAGGAGPRPAKFERSFLHAD